MMLEAFLRIVELSLAITLEIIKGIPLEDRAAIWKQHQENIQWWRDLFEKAQSQEGSKTAAKS